MAGLGLVKGGSMSMSMGIGMADFVLFFHVEKKNEICPLGGAGRRPCL